MPLYIRLIKYTEQGLRTLDQLPQRIQEVKRIVEQNGAKVLQSYVTLGPYDVVSIIEAPDDEAALRIGVQIAKMGNLTSTTLKAFPMDKFAELVK